ncbi:hypothetical protein ncot_10620 [Nocardioides sp. JQ2195]|uniref:hypothetical protein n=1 Tax=Nocardioides sp. JQ2195 TaxID=2592334 RepID=UPI00143E3D63|nr:hypothetical protein [Nocardioides sp. JQ2195]QIX26996.1 hypothetical protein ncot_10620 [Nocardioides sp. JQ2195]
MVELIGVSTTTVQRWVTTGRLTVDKHPSYGWIRFTQDEIDRLAAERRQRISYATAAKLIGVSTSTIRTFVRGSEVAHRTAPQQQPSISRRYADDLRDQRDESSERFPARLGPGNAMSVHRR